MLARGNHTSLSHNIVIYDEKGFVALVPGATTAYSNRRCSS